LLGRGRRRGGPEWTTLSKRLSEHGPSCRCQVLFLVPDRPKPVPDPSSPQSSPRGPKAPLEKAWESHSTISRQCRTNPVQLWWVCCGFHLGGVVYGERVGCGGDGGGGGNATVSRAPPAAGADRGQTTARSTASRKRVSVGGHATPCEHERMRHYSRGGDRGGAWEGANSRRCGSGDNDGGGGGLAALPGGGSPGEGASHEGASHFWMAAAIAAAR
jgi:hypothetical protein